MYQRCLEGRDKYKFSITTNKSLMTLITGMPDIWTLILKELQ